MHYNITQPILNHAKDSENVLINRSDVGQRTEGAATASEYHLHHGKEDGLLPFFFESVHIFVVYFRCKSISGGLTGWAEDCRQEIHLIKLEESTRWSGKEESKTESSP